MIYLIDEKPECCPLCCYNLWEMDSLVGVPSGVAFGAGDVWHCGGCDARFRHMPTHRLEQLLKEDSTP